MEQTPPTGHTQDAAGGLRIDRSARWGAIELVVTQQDISAAIAWQMREDRHAVIVHLGGPMRRLEMELDGAATATGLPTAGDIWVVPAGHSYASQAQGGAIRYGVLYVDPRQPEIGLEGGEIAPRLAHRDEFLYRSVECLVGLIGRNDDVSEMLGISLSQALSLRLLQAYTIGGAAAGRRGPTLPPPARARLQDHIHAHLGEPIRLEALADLAGMSPHTLLVAFRQAFGATPAQYVIAQRLHRARWLLANTAQDITTIALETGFASHSHLSTTFKRHVSLTPQEFRRRWQD